MLGAERPDGQLTLLPARIVHIPRALWYGGAKNRTRVLLAGRPDMRGGDRKELYRATHSGVYIVARFDRFGDLFVRVHGTLTGSEEAELEAMRADFIARLNKKRP